MEIFGALVLVHIVRAQRIGIKEKGKILTIVIMATSLVFLVVISMIVSPICMTLLILKSWAFT